MYLLLKMPSDFYKSFIPLLKLNCDNTKTRDPKYKHLLWNLDRSSAFTDDLLRKAELFKEMFPEKNQQFPFICIEECTLHTLISYIVYPGLIINQNKLLYSRLLFAISRIVLSFFSESSSDFTSERKTSPLGCTNILIFYVFAHCYISKLGIGKTRVDRLDIFIKIRLSNISWVNWKCSDTSVRIPGTYE